MPTINVASKGKPALVTFLLLLAAAAPLSAQDSLDGLFDNVMDIDISEGRSFGDGFTAYGEDEGGSFFDDIDSLFEDAEDISTQEAQARNEAEKPAPTVATSGVNSLVTDKSPITFSGRLKGEVGLGYAHHPTKESGFSGYFDFENYLTFNARASQNLSITGEFLTEFPDFSFELYQMYFDYRLFDRIYLSGGKRQYKWGYVRLFDDDDEYDTEGRFQPNILYDSRKNISARLIVPVSIFSFTGVVMYPLSTDSTTSTISGGDPVYPSEMSIAGSAEMRIKRVTLNFFGRKFPSGSTQYQTPILGAEAKTSIFGVDLYAHTQMRIADKSEAIRFNREGFEKITTIGGIQRVWDQMRPVIGLNFEFQNVWDARDASFSNRLAFVGAVSKIGPGERVTIGVEWNHNITDACGDVTPGIIVSGFLPHARWKTAAEIYYGEDSSGAKISSPQINFGSTIYLEMNY